MKEKISALTTIATPTVTYLGAFKDTRFSNPGGAGFASGEFILIVDVLVSNDTPNQAHFDATDFSLKDIEDNVFDLLRNSSVGSQPRFVGGVTGLPGGRSEIKSRDLKPGEKVKGSLLFYITKNVSEFTITHGDTSERITVQ